MENLGLGRRNQPCRGIDHVSLKVVKPVRMVRGWGLEVEPSRQVAARILPEGNKPSVSTAREIAHYLRSAERGEMQGSEQMHPFRIMARSTQKPVS